MNKNEKIQVVMGVLAIVGTLLSMSELNKSFKRITFSIMIFILVLILIFTFLKDNSLPQHIALFTMASFATYGICIFSLKQFNLMYDQLNCFSLILNCISILISSIFIALFLLIGLILVFVQLDIDCDLFKCCYLVLGLSVMVCTLFYNDKDTHDFIVADEYLYKKAQKFEEKGKYDLAFYWYNKASRKGNEDAMEKIGYYYYKGIEVKVDKKKAYKYFCDAVENGSTDSMFWLGICYDEGIGVEKNYAESYEWFKAAADRDIVQSYYYLGEYYYYGKGVERNYVKAFNYFAEGAKEKDYDCMYFAAICCYFGQGTEQNKLRGIMLFKEAAQNGHILSQKILDGFKMSY